MALNAMDEVRIETAARMADPASVDRVTALEYSNLTAPVLAEMLAGGCWGALVSIAHMIDQARSQGYTTNGEWGVETPSGWLQLRITTAQRVALTLFPQENRGVIGPDKLLGGKLSVYRTTLPEAVLSSVRGRRVGDLLDAPRFAFLADAPVTRGEGLDAGFRLTLRLPAAAPTPDDIAGLHREHLARTAQGQAT